MDMPATLPASENAQDTLPRNVSAIIDAAAQFQSISIAELGQSALMDRIDSKFIVPVSVIPALLSSGVGRYRVLEVNGQRLCGYATTYYDTADLAFYRAHQTGRLPRRKVRIRDYVDTGARFLEEKVKNNKGRTIKSRVAIDHRVGAGDGLDRLLAERSPEDTLSESMRVAYHRITLVDTVDNERVTIDVGLRLAFAHECSAFPNVAIVEVKRAQRSRSAFLDEMRARNLRASSFSKYCLGVSVLRREATGARAPSVRRLLGNVDARRAYAG